MAPRKIRVFFFLTVLGLAVGLAPNARSQEALYAFRDFILGTLPADWQSVATHAMGRPADWRVIADPQTGVHVVSITYIYDNYFKVANLLFSPVANFQDGDIEVRLRAVSGSNDQGGGIFWRARDQDNYYAMRYDPLKGNLVLFFVESGERIEVARSSLVDAGPGWFVLRVRHVGNRIQGYLNDALLIEMSDSGIYQPGKVGMWTSSDAVSEFDYLRVRSQGNVRPLIGPTLGLALTPGQKSTLVPTLTLTPTMTPTPTPGKTS
jgi:hypothetical protein